MGDGCPCPAPSTHPGGVTAGRCLKSAHILDIKSYDGLRDLDHALFGIELQGSERKFRATSIIDPVTGSAEH